jgi:hypothetical protein
MVNPLVKHGGKVQKWGNQYKGRSGRNENSLRPSAAFIQKKTYYTKPHTKRPQSEVSDSHTRVTNKLSLLACDPVSQG